jgi:hypothetical protein
MKGLFFLIVVLLFSLGLFLLGDTRKVQRTFFFPEVKAPHRDTEDRISGEERVIPRQRKVLDNIRLLVEEVILGPLSHIHSRLVSSEVKVYSLVLDQRVLYLNLSGDMLKPDSQVAQPLEVQIQALGNTVLFNFPFLKKVFIFVEGQIPDFSGTYGQDSYNLSNGVSYSTDILK